MFSDSTQYRVSSPIPINGRVPFSTQGLGEPFDLRASTSNPEFSIRGDRRYFERASPLVVRGFSPEEEFKAVSTLLEKIAQMSLSHQLNFEKGEGSVFVATSSCSSEITSYLRTARVALSTAYNCLNELEQFDIQVSTNPVSNVENDTLGFQMNGEDFLNSPRQQSTSPFCQSQPSTSIIFGKDVNRPESL
ncbi:MAG: hypothetical protein S4CHLAM7_13910 [Chlamydiae bacterium]|nr:hypothetical protein [Chlamydiota bacterium]